jgi:hypothetical protein
VNALPIIMDHVIAVYKYKQLLKFTVYRGRARATVQFWVCAVPTIIDVSSPLPPGRFVLVVRV